MILHTAPGGDAGTLDNPRHQAPRHRRRGVRAGPRLGNSTYAPRIPIIGIPNTRPLGPCKDTVIDIGKFRSAILFFCKE
ncbi:MAG: hypothetical protein MZU95_00590 [Desulfomicrobium escambiense]|nr:hypothetical protein [Desulfomicrobium escambiense]